MIANSQPTNSPSHQMQRCAGGINQQDQIHHHRQQQQSSMYGANMPGPLGQASTSLRPTSHMFDLANLQQQQQANGNLFDDATSSASKCDHLVSHGNHSSNSNSNSSSSSNSNSNHADMSRLQMINSNNHKQITNDVSLYSPSSSTSLLYHVYDQINVPSEHSQHQYQVANQLQMQQQQQQQQQQQHQNQSDFKRSKITFLNPANLFTNSTATMVNQQHAAVMNGGQQQAAFALNSSSNATKTTIPQQELYSSGAQFHLQQPSFHSSNSSSGVGSSSNHSSTMHHNYTLHNSTNNTTTTSTSTYGLDNQHQLMLDTILRQQHAVATNNSKAQQMTLHHYHHNRPLSSSGASSMSGHSMALTYGRQPRQANLPSLLPINSSKSQNTLASVLQSNHALNHHLGLGLNGHNLASGTLNDARKAHEYRVIMKCSILLILLAFSLIAIVKLTFFNDNQSAPSTSSLSPASQNLATFNQFQNPFLSSPASHNGNINMNGPALNYPSTKLDEVSSPVLVFESPPAVVTVASLPAPVIVTQPPPSPQQRPAFHQQPVQLPSKPVVLPAQLSEINHEPAFIKTLQQQQQQQAAHVETQAAPSSDISNNRDNNNIRGCRGRHCPSSGCPNQCSQRGQCVRVSSSGGSDAESSTSTWQQQQGEEWRCQCSPFATGDDCSILIERQCDDGLDNDRDGLVDCADSECCSDPVCQNSTLCMKSPDPLDILMRKQPPPPTSSFFQRMQFLIEKYSSQTYGNPKYFNDSILASKYVDRASVLRGRVIYQKQGVTGVRVSIAGQINLGITFTRDGGYFDLMVNGGGAATVEFRREPFATLQKTIRVPWNEIVLMDSIELQLDSQASQDLAAANGGGSPSPLPEPLAPICSAHNYRLLRPQIMAAPSSIRRVSSSSFSPSSSFSSRSQQQQQQQQQQVVLMPHQASKPFSGQQASRSVILRDSAMVQQAFTLPQSQQVTSNGRNESVSLVYISSRASEFMSTINIQLTPTIAQMQAASMGTNQQQQQQQEAIKLSDELKEIHLKIVIEGILFEQSFEPQLNLSFTYAWNRRNVYRQKSFGLSTASVSVGYEYVDCKQIIWSTKHLQLPGHELAISDIGDSWNLNIHHRYNYRESILQRGDGQNFNLKAERPRVVLPVMGDGYQRQTICPFCDGATSPSEQKLLKPQALVSGPDGSLYVGDFNLIRRIEPAPAGSSSSSAGTMSQAERVVRTVLELPVNRVPEDGYALALNLAPASAGSQQFDSAPRLYMTDSDRHQVYMIREQRSSSVDSSTTNETTPPSSSSSGPAFGGAPSASWEDILVPVAGNGQRCEPGDQLSCGDGQAALSARLIEPKALAFDLAGRMYLADGPNVRLVDIDQKIYTILGNYLPGQRHHTKFPCNSLGEAIPMHKFVPKWPRDLAINPIDETLHVLDENIVYKITQDKRIQVVAGRPAHCSRGTPASSSSSSSIAPEQATTSNYNNQRATEVHLQSARSIAFNQNGHLFISEDDSSAPSTSGRPQSARVLLVSPEDDTISLYAGLPSVSAAEATPGSGASEETSSVNKHRLSNALLPLPAGSSHASAPRASDYKFQSVSAIALDQRGLLIVADKLALRVVSVEPDLPQITQAGEYEIQSPDNPDELLVFNKHGHQVATRELLPLAIQASQAAIGGERSQSTGTASSALVHRQRQASGNKYTFAYNVNTPFGHLTSVSYANGNKISIYRDGPHHSVKMIETALGGQCKLDISRNGQVHSIATTGSAGQAHSSTIKTAMSYHIGGGLLKQSRDQTSGELFDFVYDEFGRALAIQHSSPRLQGPIECRLQHQQVVPTSQSAYLSQHCASLIVTE